MTIQEEIAADIDWRNGELAELRVILHKANLSSSQRVTYIRYIVPAIYALWEGFVKNCLELYSKEIQKSGVPIRDLNENILTFAVVADDKLSLDKERTKYETQKEFTLYIREHLNRVFPTNNKLPTKSNINKEVLTDLLKMFNLGGVDTKAGKGLNKLLTFRNSIAHGDNSIPVEEKDIDTFTKLIQDLMLVIFDKIEYAVTHTTYLASVTL